MFTILGSSGFIGSHITKYLRELQIDYFAPMRDDPAIFNNHLGHVIYCIGLTADFRAKPFEAVQAHVCNLLNVVDKTEFDSFLYLSSTRVYNGIENTEENSTLKVNPLVFGDLYNISKLMGESVCFASRKPLVRVVRLSNVYGNDSTSDNFIVSIIQEALLENKVTLKTSLESTKDYIKVDDVVKLLIQIAREGKSNIYNIASGVNISNRTILENIQSLTGCEIEVVPNAETIIFSPISTRKIRNEFSFTPIDFTKSLPELLSIKHQNRL